MPPCNHAHPPQPCMPPCNHACPLCNHACPLATTHAPWQPCTCPATMHVPPQQPCMPPGNHTGMPPPVNRMTNRFKNITLPQTSFAGGKNEYYRKEIKLRKLIYGEQQIRFYSQKNNVWDHIFVSKVISLKDILIPLKRQKTL